MPRIAIHGPPWVMWDEPPPRWVILAAVTLGVTADVTQLVSIIPGL